MLAQLLDDLRNPRQQISVICMGIKSAGKSTKALSLVRYCLDNELFDEYFLFLPAFQKGIGNAYGWLQNYKKQVCIFTEYNPAFAEYLLDRPAAEVARNKRGTLLFF